MSERSSTARFERAALLAGLAIALVACPLDPPTVDTADICVDGETRSTELTCGRNGNGRLLERCDLRAVWVLTGGCDDPDACVDGDRQSGPRPCGWNHRGAFEELCVAGRWEETSTCVDTDECVDETIEDEACDAGTYALRQRKCISGVWGGWGDCETTRILDFSTSATTVWMGTAVVLSWMTDQASSCTIEPGPLSAMPTVSGFLSVIVDETTQFRISCAFADGAVESRTVDVGAMSPEKDWVSVSAGKAHSCGVKSDGRLFCWGSWFDGRLGATWTSNLRDTLLQEETAATDWLSVSAGGAHSCGVKSNGKLLCWGKNDHGQLGDGSTTERAKPTEVESGDLTWASVSAGHEHTCGVTLDHRLYCWGNDYPANLATERGTSPLSPSEVVPADDDWLTVSVGSTHACAIKTDRRLFCWGRNNHAQIGNGERTNAYIPTQEASAGTDWVTVSAGDEYTCGVRANGSLFCWGSNGWRLGDGTGAERTSPTEVATAARDWIGVDAGWRGTCGVKSDGRIFCWGPDRSLTLDDVATTSPGKLVQVSDGDGFTSVVVGGTHACGTTKERGLICWGRQSLPLGHGAERPRLSPSEVVTAANDWKSVTAGGGHACAVKNDGRLFCWGSAILGVESGLSRHQPVQEGTGASDWASVSTSASHTCAIKTDGRLYCWGFNTMGEVGDGTTEMRRTPTQESSASSDWMAVATGGGQSCAIKVDGRLYCWGRNERGQVGDGTRVDRLTPTTVDTELPGWESIALGSSHSCGKKTDGTAFCWGANYTGAVGDGTTTERLVPTQEATGETDWSSLAAGYSRTCGVKNDGRLFCWGSRAHTFDASPQDVRYDTAPQLESMGARDWTSVTLAVGHTCGVRRGGRLSCLGDNSSGQLGDGSTTDRLSPARESTAAWSWDHASVGDGFTCARKINGRLACFGDGSSGRLGQSVEPAFGPVQHVD
jgi:alpha-tubulin suppressor-like RCC1 family protein